MSGGAGWTWSCAGGGWSRPAGERACSVGVADGRIVAVEPLRRPTPPPASGAA